MGGGYIYGDDEGALVTSHQLYQVLVNGVLYQQTLRCKNVTLTKKH